MSLGPHRAWVDESQSDRAKDPGTYVLAAAVSSLAVEADSRARMLALRLPGQQKVHWRDEGKRHKVLVEAVAACDLHHLVVVRTDAQDERPERQRRKCLERLAYELHTRWAVTEIVLESRGPADDRRDLDLFNALRGRKQVPSSLRLRHEVGRVEAMLWIPDTVCGAITSARTSSTTYRQALEPQMTVIDI